MKLLFILLSTLSLHISANAESRTNLELSRLFPNSKILQQVGMGIPAPPAGSQSTNLDPIRKAKVKFHVYKFIYTQDGTGLHGKSEDVCEKEVDVNVYDARGVSGGITYQVDNATCDTTYQGKSSVVAIYFNILLWNATPFSNESAVDLKGYTALMSAGSKSNSVDIIARDLNNHSILAHMGELGFDYSLGMPQETFVATVEFKD